jgi:hypothetical protein
MKYFILIVGLPFLLIGVLSSCSRNTPPINTRSIDSASNSYESRAANWESADVNDDVTTAIVRGDRRFLCVTGEGVYAPGLSASEFTPGITASQVDTAHYRIIDDTYDDIDPDYAKSIIRFKQAAAQYANEYNRLLKVKLADE